MYQLLKTTGLATALAFGTFGQVIFSAPQVKAFEIVIKQPHTSKPKTTRSHHRTARQSNKVRRGKHDAIWR